MTSSRKTRWQAVAALTAMMLAVLIIYRRLAAGRVLAGGDLHTYFFPYWVAAARTVQAGELPLWNPHLFAGAPLLANSQAGVFYPPNWLLWLLGGASLEELARTLHWNVLLHLLLAAFAAWLLARRLGASPWGAALSGLLYAGSGYAGLHVEHLNQLQALAWLPLTLLPARSPRHASAIPPASVAALALMLLAGHTQMAFIAAVAVAAWRIGEAVARADHVRGALDHLWRMAWPYALAFGIAAVQLAPTLALARRSVRSGGLPWREAVSFSVPPWSLPQALLPPYLLPPLLPEGVAYVGLIGLALAGWGAIRALRKTGHALVLPLALAALGLFLAVGGYNPLYLGAVRLGLPGFVHFRAPARFLALWALGMSLAAGLAVTAEIGASTARPRWWQPALVVLAAAELALAAEALPHTDATALRAYTDLRPATAHLVAAAGEPGDSSAGRFLSISQTLFDVGDDAEIDAIYGEALSADALWAFKVAAKQREVLAPNLSMAFGVPALDGYDGGLLPTAEYVAFSRLMLPEGTRDGRLRENLAAIPDARWLSLAGVRFVTTDKVGDAWIDGIFYDRQFRLALEPGEIAHLAWLPGDFTANALGLLYAGEGAVSVLFDGEAELLALPPSAGDALVPVRLRWAEPSAVLGIAFHSPGKSLVVGGVSLIDERTGAFYPLTASEHVRQVHSGDVKIYENLDVLPRAFVVPFVECVDDEDMALARMQSPDFDPAREAVVLGCGDVVLPDGGYVEARAQVVAYEAARVEIEAEVPARGLLVLADACDPGWRVDVEPLDGGEGAAFAPEPLRADLLFRGVLLERGAWRVTWRYWPEGLTVGAAISAASLLAWAVTAWAWERRA